MALQHLRSSTANKRPTPAAMSDGQLAMNTNSASPGLFLKDSSGALVKVGPVHVGTTAPNASPASGGQSGNTVGEQWLDTSSSTYVFKIWDGTAWRSEAGEFVNVTGDRMTGNLEFGPGATIIFEGATDDAFETILTAADPTADRTITLPNVSGTVVTTGDTGTVTSAMLADGTIVNADVSASAAIAGTKISPDFGSQNVTTTGTATAAALIPSGSSVPTNGVYLPSANNVAISTGASQRLLIDSSGNIGINGTIAGTAKLQVSGALRLFGSGDGTETSNACLFQASGGGLGFGVNSSQRMILDTSGRLGLGTSTVDYALDVRGTNPRIQIKQSSSSDLSLFQIVDNSSNAFYIGADNSTGSNFSQGNYARLIYSAGAYPLRFSTNGTHAMTINSSQRVGIGTTAPLAKLHVNNGTNENIHFTTGGSGDQRISAINDANNATVQLSLQGSPLLFRGLGGSEVGRWDTSGRFLVGTSSSPSAGNGQYGLLVVQGYAGGATGGGYISLQRGEAATAITAEEELGYINFGDNAGNTFANIACRADATAGSGDYPGRLAFATTADGASSPTERMRITSTGQVRLAGAGITFNGDTATANELDDYEEGTWTPVYVPNTGAFSAITYDPIRYGKYTKVGNLVTCSFAIRTDALTVGTASGPITLQGLPFTSASTAGFDAGGGSLNYSSTFGGDNPTSAVVIDNSTTCELYYRATSNGVSTAFDTTDLGTGANNNYMLGTLSYFVS